MTISPVASGAAHNSGGASNVSSVAVTKPSGGAWGDVRLAAVHASGGTGRTITPPANWTLIRRSNQSTNTALATYSYVIPTNEGATHTWSLDTATVMNVTMITFNGVDTTTPVHISAETLLSTAATTITAPSVTTTVDNAWVVRVFAALFLGAGGQQVAVTPAAGFTERDEDASINISGSGSRATEWSDQNQVLTPAGASGTEAATTNVSANGAWQTIALNPAIGGPSVGMVGGA